MEGLEIHRVRRGIKISMFRNAVCMFDSDYVFIENEAGKFGKPVSVCHHVQKANRMKSTHLGFKKSRINRKA
jgi:hypothetical protein